ncbi:kynureninase [Leucobacter sp. OLJS4]|uniref:kynureninase n=1 Tax=unclassified Leucobacter TaxID=2621730 RepID=UPI000C18BE84|nr:MULTISPECIES: kynureninase [unclassified Leucobacter]PIJ47897.1 kynureninase [Leucobacter sp. OLES1]PII81654.1 kynureninase [Leucobacter sp. OLCALW19]PII86326.1 kynureninase [Leucobacter sp. OLTLW20]PII90221.1 kynureninase [Leucobacter sp. OLAS13]PII97254.1 kynureninase [Leucobacter sp. OLDS2]
MTDTDRTPITRAFCAEADAQDPLAGLRDEFLLPEGLVYLDGNSLGARPKGALERAAAVIEREWGHDLIASWNTHDWFELPKRIGAKIGRLIGGERGGCVVSDTTSINLFKVLAAALKIQERAAPERRVIVSERENFPTDLYMVEGLAKLLDRGYELRLVDEDLPLSEALRADVAVLLLTHVNYRTGALWDMAAETRRAHEAGVLVIWDLCHSVGAVPVRVSEADADFAIGCTYKYLNGGPGSPAFVWVHERHQATAEQPLSGWWGHAAPFDMAVAFEPAPGIDRFLTGTQPIVSLAMTEVGVDLALSVDDCALREKSLALTTLFMHLVDQRLSHHDLTLITPEDPGRRGSHVSYRHPEGYAVMQALIANGVVGDYREPEVLRFGITPLYVGFLDVWDAVETLRWVLDEEVWRAPEFQTRGAVT